MTNNQDNAFHPGAYPSAEEMYRAKAAYYEQLTAYLDKKIKSATTACDAAVPWLLDEALHRTHFTPSNEAVTATFQARVKPWMDDCFGQEISNDTVERNHRFLEEALELVQSCGCSADEAHQLVDYVFGRPVGEKEQEVGGVCVTLAALCLAQSIDMHAAGEKELSRIWDKIDVIRQKQAAKPKHSPLPE